MLSDPSGPHVLPQKCPACGSTWFREASFFEFVPARFWSHELEPSGHLPMTILVCLCGQPVPPLLQGVPSPRTAQAIGQFLDSLRQAQEQPKADDLAAAFRSHAAVERAQLPALRQRVRKLEQAIGRQLAKQRVATGERKARGRHWQLPRPMPTSSQRGTRGREWLVHQLQKQGLTFRKARAAVTAVLKVVREGLRNDGLLQTPMGEFYLRSLTPPYERKRWGRNQTLYLQRTRVVFRPNPGLLGGERKRRKK